MSVSHPNHDCATIWVPHPNRDWVTFRIVEAGVDMNGQLHFRRLRHDKRVANLVDVANAIFCAKATPTLLDELAVLLKHPDKSSGGDIKLLHSYRGDATSSKGSSFSSLRCMHSNIKRWLYEAFGGG